MTSSQLKTHLKNLPHWRYLAKTKSIATTHKAKNFLDVVRLIRKIAVLAEKADHHPDLHLTRYRHLRIVLSTHSLGQVSFKDIHLASKIEKLLSR